MSNAQLALAEKSLQICVDSSAQKLNVTSNFTRIILPFRMNISGPTMSGKSEFIFSLLKYRDIMFDKVFDRILYCIPAKSTEHHYEYITRLSQFVPNLEVIEGLPKNARDCLLEGEGHKLIILDDLVHEMLKSEEIVKIFTVHSHHARVSISKTVYIYAK